MFSFRVRICSGKDSLRQACAKYDPGQTIIRKEVTHFMDGSVLYIVDVYEPTLYGMELLEWLQRDRKKNPNVPPGLSGPIWCIGDFMPMNLTLAPSPSRHS